MLSSFVGRFILYQNSFHFFRPLPSYFCALVITFSFQVVFPQFPSKTRLSVVSTCCSNYPPACKTNSHNRLDSLRIPRSKLYVCLGLGVRLGSGASLYLKEGLRRLIQKSVHIERNTGHRGGSNNFPFVKKRNLKQTHLLYFCLWIKLILITRYFLQIKIDILCDTGFAITLGHSYKKFS